MRSAVFVGDYSEVDKSNYTVTEGSTIVTFKPEFLETLSEGEYMVMLMYSDGNSAESKLTVREAADDNTGGADNTGNTGDTGNTGGTDNTNDTDDEETNDIVNNDTESSEVEQSKVESSEAVATGDNSSLTLWSVLLVFGMAAMLFVRIRNKKC